MYFVIHVWGIECFNTKDANVTIIIRSEFSRLIDITNGEHDLTVWVRPDFDIDGQFDAICDDTGERLTINGWFFEIVE